MEKYTRSEDKHEKWEYTKRGYIGNRDIHRDVIYTEWRPIQKGDMELI